MGAILLENGTIIDGSGRERFRGHVLIEDGKISEVISGSLEPRRAATVVDAQGCIVCPGFIDMHSHSDWLLCLEENPDLLKCLIEQGITTVVAGNCGFSPAPYKEKNFFQFGQFTPLLVRVPEFTWETMDDFLLRLEEIGPCLNIAELAGHASIRFAAAETLRGRMKEDELAWCLDLLSKSLDQGACGLSFGLGYEPGMYSPLDEIEAFTQIAKEKGKPVTVHLKALSALSPTYPITTLTPHNLKALAEMLDVARKTGARLQLSHFIFVGRNSLWTADRAISMVEQARSDGVDVMFDAFPYTCGNTTITVVLPHWFLKRGAEAYRNPWLKLRLRLELEAGFRLVGFMYHDFQVMDAAIPGSDDLNGLRITEIARKWGMSPFNTLLRLCEKSGGGTLMLFHAYSGEPGREDVIERVLSHELCLFETDAVIKDKGYPNPSAMGAFPRILGPLARDRKLFTLEQAIRRSTSESAQRFNIRDRGEIAPGKAADIVVFDPAVISDTPPAGITPSGRPAGIRNVFINGKSVVSQGLMTANHRAGMVIRT